jgi:hypothetical protein
MTISVAIVRSGETPPDHQDGSAAVIAILLQSPNVRVENAFKDLTPGKSIFSSIKLDSEEAMWHVPIL